MPSKSVSTLLLALILSLPMTETSVADSPSAAKGTRAITFGVSEGVCRIAFDTRDDIITPTTPVVTDIVDIPKPCPGEVIGSLSSEAATPANAIVNINMRATCLASGGFVNPCTTNQVVFANPPGPSILKINDPNGVEVRTLTMVWPRLKRGLWRFEVVATGSNGGRVESRSFVVTALTP